MKTSPPGKGNGLQVTVNWKAVALDRLFHIRSMRDMGLAGVCPGPNLSRRYTQHRVYPYLLRGLSIDRPNQVWGIDITYIQLAKGWMYLVAILDWYSRYIVAWELGGTLAISFVCATVKKALAQVQLDILNCDQGSQFTCRDYVELVQAAGKRQIVHTLNPAFEARILALKSLVWGSVSNKVVRVAWIVA